MVDAVVMGITALCSYSHRASPQGRGSGAGAEEATSIGALSIFIFVLHSFPTHWIHLTLPTPL